MTCGMAARSKTANDDGAHFSFSPIELVAKRHVSTLSEGRDGTDSVVFKWVSKQRSKSIVKANRFSTGFSAAITQLGTMSIMWPWWPLWGLSMR